jgi:hypothetical protein
MPKIRGVKPDYWTDEDIVDLSIPARLLFIGLWNYACDNGHLQDKPKQIKMRIFPGDDVNATELCANSRPAGASRGATDGSRSRTSPSTRSRTSATSRPATKRAATTPREGFSA